MREFNPSPNAKGGFEDFFFSSRTPSIERALVDMSAISEARGAAYNAANLFYPLPSADETERKERLAWRASLRERLGAATMAARWEIFRDNNELASVDLVRVNNMGSWEATEEAEAQMIRIANDAKNVETSDGLIARDSPEAKRTIMFDRHFLLHELTAAGLIAVRRKRLMMVASPQDAGGKHLEVDKASEFVLNVHRMAEIAPDTMFELDLRRGVVWPEAGGLVDCTIEAAIADRDEMLVPATTTYSGGRKVTAPKQAEAESGLVDA